MKKLGLLGFIYAICISFLCAATNGASQYNKDNQKIFELLADNVNAKDNIIHAIGNAILASPDLYALADQIDYDTETKQVQAKGDVRIYREGNLLVRTKSVNFRLDDKYGMIEPLYLQDAQTGMWVSAKQALSQTNKYFFKKAIISGCAIQNPIWRMEASSGSYANENKVMTLWNPRIYIGDVPIFYFPYFRASTNMSRQSGLLMPDFITSSTEGLIYAQPYFIAPKNFWDITLTPQVRTDRGGGGMVEFRMVDYNNDKTYLELGYLYSSDDYTALYSLRNQHIFGGRLYHSSKQTLQKYFNLKSDLDNGVYLNFLYMNDLDYMRLKYPNRTIYDATYTSKFNIYTQTEKHYFGFNMRYFLNFADLDNDSTMQSLPNLQYHKYIDSLFFKWLLYSVDYQFKNTMRNRGYGYIENGVRVPVGLQISLLKKYFSLGIFSEFYGENLFITQAQNSDTYIPSVLESNGSYSSTSNGNILSANYSLSLNSDLSKKYNKFFHTIQFEALFSGPYISYSNGLLNRNVGTLAAQTIANNVSSYSYIWDPSGISAYAITDQTLDLKLTQYFLTNKGKEILNWRIFQRLNFDDYYASQKDAKAIAMRPLESKVTFSIIDGLTLSTSLFYSFYYQEVTELATALNFSKRSISSYLSYYYKNAQGYDYLSNTLTTQTSSNYMRGHIAYDFRIFALSATAGYDIDKNVLLDWDIGIYKNIRCFGIGLRFVNQRRPILTSDSSNPYYIQQDYYIKLTLNFSPLTSTSLTTRF